MKSRGVTLVELMVVLAIIITLTGVVFTSQSSFNKTLELANTAYDVALTLRSAESYGIGSRVTTGAANAGYGLHFESGASTFTLFADTSPAGSSGSLNCPTASADTPNCKPGDGIYTSGTNGASGVDTFVQTYTLGNGVTVNALNASKSGSQGKSGNSVGSLDIVFVRPDPNPFIRANGSRTPNYNEACIKLASPQGSFSFVKVTSSGLIAVNNTSCL